MVRDERMKENEIYVAKGTDHKDMTIRLLNKADLKSLIPSREVRIGIKPNLVSASEPAFGATTHPEIVEGIIDYLKENGFADIVVLESSWVGGRTREAMELCGYDTLCREKGVPFYDLQEDKGETVSVPGDAPITSLTVCRRARGIGFLINVPVLKGHCQTKVSCALKNLKGLLPSSEKRRFHALGLHEPIACLNAAIRQDFIVVDNICGDLDFEDGGNPVVMNRVLCGRDPVLMDAFACHMLHYQPEEVPYIGLAAALHVGCADLSKAAITVLDGSPLEELPLSRKVVEVRDVVCEVESCSACYAYLVPALQKLKEESLLPLLKEKISIGQGFRGQSGHLGIGSCTRQFTHHLPGCPPTEGQIYDFLKTYIEAQSAIKA